MKPVRRRSERSSQLRCAAVSVVLTFVVPASALAVDVSDCTELCGSGSGTCLISGLRTIASGVTEIDCTGRTITVGSTGTIKVDDAFVTFRADSVVVNSSGVMKAVDNQGTERTGLMLDVTGAVSITGRLISVNNGAGTEIVIEAGGDVTIYNSGSDGIEAEGGNGDHDGGDVEIRTEGDLKVYNPIRAEGTGDPVSGGDVTLVATGDIITTLDGKILTTGRKNDAGTISMEADGDISIGANLEAEGKLNDGNGGYISMVADGGITINGGDLLARGGVGASGGNSAGGSVNLQSGCGGVTINGDIDVTGGDQGAGLDGGALIVDTLGDLTIEASVSINTEARAEGADGGDISLVAGGAFVMKTGATIVASGDDSSSNEGAGARIDVEACTIDVQGTAGIDATGFDGGNIVMNASAPALSGAGTQPLTISSSASIAVAADNDGWEGEVSLAPKDLQEGECSNDDTIACWIDTDCTVGCETGDCLYMNPDTGGDLAAFDQTPERVKEATLADCTTACQ